jgi:carbon monoxide dehydrogenase subunit G
MQSKQTKTFIVKEPIEKVWAFLSDPRKVAPCLPGAQITEQVDDRTFKGTITVKIGPVSTQFKGEIKMEKLDLENHEMQLSGSGQDPRGGGGATMTMTGKLNTVAEGTEVAGTIESTITGRLAQFGSRMMEDVSNHLFNQFINSFEARLAAEDNPDAQVPAEPEQGQAINALPLLGEVAKGVVKRMIGRKSEE